MYTEKGSFGISISHLWTDYWIDFAAWPMISFCSDEPGVTAHICIRSYKTGRSLPPICIYMYVYCGLQLPFIAHHCLSLFLMFHGELRNLKPLRRAFRLMPRSILQGAHGSDICSYVPQLPDFLGAVNKNLKPRNKSTKNSTTALLLGPLGLSFQVFNCI